MSYVSREIHTRRCYCTIFTNFCYNCTSAHCHTEMNRSCEPCREERWGVNVGRQNLVWWRRVSGDILCTAQSEWEAAQRQSPSLVHLDTHTDKSQPHDFLTALNENIYGGREGASHCAVVPSSKNANVSSDCQRISFKLAATYQSIHGTYPSYLQSCVSPKLDVPSIRLSTVRQTGVSGFWCHRLERPASPRHICAITRGFQMTRDLPVFPFLPRHYHTTHAAIMIHHYCLDTCGSCNNYHYLIFRPCYKCLWWWWWWLSK